MVRESGAFLGSISRMTSGVRFCGYKILQTLKKEFNLVHIGNTINGMLGNHPAVMLSVFSYMADVTSKETRTTRITIVDGLVHVSQIIRFVRVRLTFFLVKVPSQKLLQPNPTAFGPILSGFVGFGPILIFSKFGWI